MFSNIVILNANIKQISRIVKFYPNYFYLFIGYFYSSLLPVITQEPVSAKCTISFHAVKHKP